MLECQKPHVAHVFWDPAWDLGEGDLDTYLEDRDNSFLKARDGARPIAFHCRPLSTTICLHHIGPLPPGAMKWAACFRAAVVRVDNPMGWMHEDHPEGWAPKSTLRGELDPTTPWALTQREVDLFTPDVVQEVGEVIFKRSFLALRQPGGAGLPDTSLRILGVMRVHLAALRSSSRNTIPTGSTPPAETSTSEGSTSQKPGSEPSESTKSGADGGATVTGSGSEDDGPTESST